MYESYRSHVYKKHREELISSKSTGDDDPDDNDSPHIDLQDGIESEFVMLTDASHRDSTGSVKHAAAFILNSMQQRKISQVCNQPTI